MIHPCIGGCPVIWVLELHEPVDMHLEDNKRLVYNLEVALDTGGQFEIKPIRKLERVHDK